MVTMVMMTLAGGWKTVKKLLPLQLILFICCFGSGVLAQSGQPLLEASVERQTVIDGESVFLYIKGENLQSLPDVSVLSKQFDVLDSRRSNSQVIESGVVKTQFLMRFELLAKNLGQTSIPPFTADGVSTKPIAIDVVERGTPGAVPRDKVFAEVTLDKENVYVQAQVVMSLHVLDDGTLVSIDPPLPAIPDVQVERLSGGDQRIETRDGEEYRVHTWRYALFPQKHGEVEIPRLLIPGSVRDPSYGGGLIMRNMATRRIQIRTSPVSFNVSPRSAASTADWWLPAESLQFQHQWSDDINNVTAGEPLTLTLAVTTKGATSNQLPEIAVPSVSGLKIYPDVPALESQPDDDGLVSQRREKWSVIPQREGQVSLPEMTIKWWDTLADEEREATIPAQVLNIAADPNAPQPLPAPSTDPLQAINSGVASDNQAVAQEPLVVVNSEPSLWRTIAVFALLGWLLTAGCWRVSACRKRVSHGAATSEDTAPKMLLSELKKASEGDDQVLFRNRLLSWARRQWPRERFNGPVDVANKLNHAALQAELQTFEASLYARSSTSSDLQKIYRLLKTALQGAEVRHDGEDYLPSL